MALADYLRPLIGFAAGLLARLGNLFETESRVRAQHPFLRDEQVRQVVELAVTGNRAAAAANLGRPEQRLEDFLGGAEPPGESVQLHLRYLVEDPNGNRFYRAVSVRFAWGTSLGQALEVVAGVIAERLRRYPGRRIVEAFIVPPLIVPPAA